MLLAIETSTSRSSVALADEGGSVLAAAELGRDRRHGEFVTPAIAHLLHHLDAGIDDVSHVAAGIGPGLYTGLRVGLVTATTIAATRAAPCVGVVGTDAIAHGLRHADREVVVALDARRREVYLARYPGAGVADRDGPVRSDVEVLSRQAAAERLRATGGRVLLAGDGAQLVVAALDDHRVDGTDQTAPVGVGDLDLAMAGTAYAHPTAAALVPLAVDAIARGDTGGPEVLRPLYLRDADARIGWDQRGRLRGGAAVS